MNSLGTLYRITSFGESHGTLVGAVLDGLPAGMPVDMEHLMGFLERRRPGQTRFSTPRSETDRPQVVSGILDGSTTGAPLTIIVYNENTRSTDYELEGALRPGHADMTQRVKYGMAADLRGGGRHSGRLTVVHTIAGALACQALTFLGFDIDVLAHTTSIGEVKADEVTLESMEQMEEARCARGVLGCVDDVASTRMEEVIDTARKAEDSLGGMVECVAMGVPAGLGEPLFDRFTMTLASALFSIPAVKGLEFGDGLSLTSMKGSESNDPLDVKDGCLVALSNHMGGVLGGITNGMPLVVRVCVKPTASIGLEQNTVTYPELERTKVRVGGRHDPCIVPRVLPVVEATVWSTLLDHVLMARAREL